MCICGIHGIARERDSEYHVPPHHSLLQSSRMQSVQLQSLTIVVVRRGNCTSKSYATQFFLYINGIQGMLKTDAMTLKKMLNFKFWTCYFMSWESEIRMGSGGFYNFRKQTWKQTWLRSSNERRCYSTHTKLINDVCFGVYCHYLFCILFFSIFHIQNEESNFVLCKCWSFPNITSQPNYTL